MIRCQFEHGNNALLRHVTVDAIVIHENKLLVVKRAVDSLVEPGKYALPGGFMERDETAAEASLRELHEETGYKGKNPQLLTVIDSPHRKGDDRQNIGFVFLVELDEKTADHDSEIESVHWFELKKLPSPDLFGFDHWDMIKLAIT